MFERLLDTLEYRIDSSKDPLLIHKIAVVVGSIFGLSLGILMISEADKISGVDIIYPEDLDET